MSFVKNNTRKPFGEISTLVPFWSVGKLFLDLLSELLDEISRHFGGRRTKNTGRIPNIQIRKEWRFRA